MPHINLLPWREELRKRRQQEFGIIAGVFFLAMLGLVGLVHLQFNKMTEHQNDRNQYLQQQIAQLDKKIEEITGLEDQKRRLLARMEIIQELQASRPEIVHLVEELVRQLPEGVYYTKIAQRGRNLTIEGVAQSNARVSSLMRQLDASPWLQDPALVEIQAEKGKSEAGRLSRFVLRITQAEQEAAGDEAEAEGTT